tara:strand:- start:860 stop:2422 length:1563 start_codon:yes stop_codon:yes gene_type:complete
MQQIQISKSNKWYFVLIVSLTFLVFLSTSDGHRYSFDEDVVQQQSYWITTLTPDERFVPGESRIFFQFPEYFPNNNRSICLNELLCSTVSIGSSLVQVPFLFANHNFHLITQDTVLFSVEDFGDGHYTYWRNSISPDFTFLELLFGPTLLAFGVGVFFLILRTYGLSFSSSIIVTLLFAFSTTVWSYSQTSLNVVPASLFILLGFYFFRKWINQSHKLNLLMSSASLGFGFLIRPDTILFIIPLFFYFIFILFRKSNKIKNAISFILPLSSSYVIHLFIDKIRFGPVSSTYVPTPDLVNSSFLSNVFGMLFSPGVGMLIFSPILFTCFFSFVHFFQKHKAECILFITIIISFLILYGQSLAWHGLNSWGERYLFVLTPFFLIPLGFSLEKITNKSFKILLIVLGSLGLFFNISYLLTDVSWFIWGLMGSGKGLYELGHIGTNLWIHPLVLWTFEYSQLTHAIRYLFLYLDPNLTLKPDIYLLKVWGSYLYSIFLILPIGTLIYFIMKLNKKPENIDISTH